MADSDKDILITPNTSVATTHPKMTFTGKDNSPVDLKILDDNTLSFEGAQGQVLSVSPIMNTGDIFSVNDISGVQSMAINADGTISMNAQTKSVTITNSASNVSNLILENTNADEVDGPILEFYRNTVSPADGGDAGTLLFTGQDDGGNKQEYGRITMEFDDVSNSGEEGELIFRLTEAGSVEQEYMRLRGSSRQIEFNTGQDDIDLVWNSDSANDVFYCNAGTSRIGIKTNSPDTDLHIEGSVLIDAYEQGAGSGLYFRDGFLNTNQPSITVQDHSGANPDGLAISAFDGISFRLDATEKARFDSSGNLGIGTTSPNAKLHVSGDTYIQSATANQLLRVHADTDSSPSPRIEMMRGAHDTWGTGDNYTDWRIENSNDLIFYSGFSSQSSGAAVERLRIHSDSDGITINNAYKLPALDGTVDEILKTNGSDVVRFSSRYNGYSQFFYQGDDVSNTANYNFMVLGANASSSNINSYGMPVAGTIKGMTVRNAGGGTITDTTNGATFALRVNGASTSGDDYSEVVIDGDNMIRPFGNSSAYAVITVDTNQAFVAGDAIQVRRVSGDITFEEVLITLWVDFT
tara:strand:+ start:2552 stop:4288 length:1737 start_codon:yes stop_codon:yes gene_type:complete